MQVRLCAILSPTLWTTSLAIDFAVVINFRKENQTKNFSSYARPYSFSSVRITFHYKLQRLIVDNSYFRTFSVQQHQHEYKSSTIWLLVSSRDVEMLLFLSGLRVMGVRVFGFPLRMTRQDKSVSTNGTLNPPKFGLQMFQ